MFRSLNLIISKKKALKKGFKRESTQFGQVKKVGIIINDKNLAPDEVDNFIHNFKKEGIKVDVLYLQSKKETPKLKNSFITFAKKDIKWSGKILNFQLKKFIRTEFDYLFSIATKSSLPTDAILALSKAKCRVGKFGSSQNDLYELMVHSDGKSLKDLSNQMYHYTSKIK